MQDERQLARLLEDSRYALGTGGFDLRRFQSAPVPVEPPPRPSPLAALQARKPRPDEDAVLDDIAQRVMLALRHDPGLSQDEKSQFLAEFLDIVWLPYIEKKRSGNFFFFFFFFFF
jgi:hypothetical protein